MINESNQWQPSASFITLKKQAEIIDKIRTFFAERQVLEVSTPLLSHSTNTDVHIASFQIPYKSHPKTLYLQTSPEFHMKRLLAAGSGSIFQICKAFREEEQGKWHNPEFTLLEWYRIDFDQFQLMDEVDLLLQRILHSEKAKRLTYAEVFQNYLNIDPYTITISELERCLEHHDIIGINNVDKDTYLNLLLTHLIEPQLGLDQPLFVYDYPASQAALSKIRKGNPDVAERFEVYVNGIELANGFHELTDATEQRERMMQDNLIRKKLKLPQISLDENFLAALNHGLPNCAGIALGLDRLFMLALQATRVSEVMSFDFSRA